MNINLTLIVQAIHFFIAYWMLRRFFFRPAVAIIENHNAVRNSLLSLISQQEQGLEIQKKARQHQWHECQGFFRSNRPIVESGRFITTNSSVPYVMYKQISDAEIDQQTFDIKKTIEEKIKHVW